MFSIFNLVIQGLPLLFSLAGFLVGYTSGPNWNDVILLLVFSWIAAPSFLDRFAWSDDRYQRLSFFAYGVGATLLFFTLGIDGLTRVATAHPSGSADVFEALLQESLRRASELIPRWLGPALAAVVLSGLYAFLIRSHIRLLRKVRLRLRWHHQAQFAGFYMALSQGIYEKHGLDVAILERDIHRPIVNTVGGREDEFGLIMATEAVQFASEGRDIIAVEIFVASAPLEILINVSQLRAAAEAKEPVKILSVEHYIDSAILEALLAREGLPPVKFVTDYYSDNNGAADFLKGEYSAISVHRANEKLVIQRQMSTANWISLAVINPEKHGLHLLGETLVTSETLIRDHPEIVSAMQRASIEGWEYAREHHEEAVHVSMAYVRRSSQAPTIIDLREGEAHQSAMLSEMISLYDLGRDIRGRQTETVWDAIIASCEAANIVEPGVVKARRILSAGQLRQVGEPTDKSGRAFQMLKPNRSRRGRSRPDELTGPRGSA